MLCALSYYICYEIFQLLLSVGLEGLFFISFVILDSFDSRYETSDICIYMYFDFANTND